jgi:hypothetical protein
MSREEEWLARELAKVSQRSAQLAAAVLRHTGDPTLKQVAQAGNMSAAQAAASGARLASRFLPSERYQLRLHLRAEPRVVLQQLHQFFRTAGRVIDPQEQEHSDYPTVAGILGSGFFNLNPTIVYAEIVELTADGQVVLLLTGAAKEGLIKQRSAQKAVQRVAEMLRPLMVSGS